MDTKALRTVLGRSPSGVSIVTTIDAAGHPVGMTANSIVPAGGDSLHLIWSLGKASRSRAAFAAAGRFGVSLLAADQEAVSRRMAAWSADRFAGIAWHAGAATGVPLIDGSLAAFECVTTDAQELGDHVTFIGRVATFEWRPGAGPLLYVGGRYSTIPDVVRPHAEAA